MKKKYLNKIEITIETLELLYNHFDGLSKQTDDISWIDRMQAEGYIYACREYLNNFTYKYKNNSMGFEKIQNPYFEIGYNEFKEKYN